MDNIKKFHLFTTSIAAFLAGVTSFSEPLKANAAIQGAFLSDVIIITENDKEKAKEDNYVVLDTPIGSQTIRNDKLGAGLTNTYLAYKTTNDANNAIHDMKFMNMNGGFDFAVYEDYLKGVETTTKQSTSNIFVAIEGYRKYYKANTVQGKFAYDALNIFYYNEYDGLDSGVVEGPKITEQGINKRLGDLFLDTTLVSNGESKILVDIFMEGNALILDAIYSVLSIANSYNDDGKNVFEALEGIKNNYSIFSDRTDLNDTLFTLESDFIRIRDEVNWYRNEATCKYEDFKTSDEAFDYSLTLLEDDYSNQTNYADMWSNAVKEIPFLEHVDYKGLSGKYNNLLELIMDEEAERKEYYPLLACMSREFRATSLLGIVDMLNNSLLDQEHYMDTINALKESDEDVKNALENGELSVFHGVDRALYQKGNVAMTTDAEDGSIKGDNSWQIMKDKRSALNRKLDGLATYLSFGIGGFTILNGVGLLVVRGMAGFYAQKANSLTASFQLGRISENLNAFVKAGTGQIAYKVVNPITIYGKTLEAGTEIASKDAGYICQSVVASNVLKENSRNAALATEATLNSVKLVLAVTLVISIAALIVSIVFAVLHNINNDKDTFSKYSDVPGILCHYQPVYNVSSNGARTKGDNGYVYYYGATNPYSVAKSAKYGNTDDGSLELGENKRNVQDIYNWELGQGKSREWLCLYTTKDKRAGYPITAKSLKITNALGSTCEGATSFNEMDIEYDINSILISNYYQDKSLKSYNKDIGNVAPTYLHFAVNKRVSYSTKVGSAISNSATWILVGVGLVAGFGGGLLGTTLLRKKKNNKQEN